MNVQVTNFPVDNLLAGSFPQITKVVTLLTGTDYKRGDVLEVNVSGKAVKLADGTKAKYILAEDADATSSDVDALVYTTGQFHVSECDLNSQAQADVEEALHLRSLFLK